MPIGGVAGRRTRSWRRDRQCGTSRRGRTLAADAAHHADVGRRAAGRCAPRAAPSCDRAMGGAGPRAAARRHGGADAAGVGAQARRARRQALRCGGGGGVRPRLRSLLQYEAALREAGRGTEAIALVRAERAAIALKGSWDFSEYAALSSVLAGAQAEQGDMEAAAATLAEAEARLAGTPFAINAAANRARYLAEGGHGKEALAVLDAVDRANAAAKGVDRVPGANLLLDAVRACALTHEGQGVAAAPLTAAIAGAIEPRSGRYARRPRRPRSANGPRPASRPRGPRRALASRPRRAGDRLGDLPRTANRGHRPSPRHRATLAQAHAALNTPPPLRPPPSTYDAALAGWRPEL
ncbi:hypothetical protein AB5I41_07015 [Sphingomonas sp. MMS24-JH45]